MRLVVEVLVHNRVDGGLEEDLTAAALSRPFEAAAAARSLAVETEKDVLKAACLEFVVADIVPVIAVGFVALQAYDIHLDYVCLYPPDLHRTLIVREQNERMAYHPHLV